MEDCWRWKMSEYCPNYRQMEDCWRWSNIYKSTNSVHCSQLQFWPLFTVHFCLIRFLSTGSGEPKHRFGSPIFLFPFRAPSNASLSVSLFLLLQSVHPATPPQATTTTSGGSPVYAAPYLRHLQNSLFAEIITAQKVMYEKFGDMYLAHFVSKALLAAHCSQDLAQQYRQKLQTDETKAFKSFYQSLIENLRQQQNGSLVFS